MGFAQRPGDPYQEALQRSLGSTPGVSTTMPVTPRGGAPAGFDQRNWDDPAMQSVKYRAGRLLHGVTKPSDMAARVQSPEFQSAFKGATFDGKDRVNFQGALSDGASGSPVYDIDVLRKADQDADTSDGFWWGHDVPGMATGPSGPLAPPTGPAIAGQQSDLMAQILAALQGSQAPDPQALLLEQWR